MTKRPMSEREEEEEEVEVEVVEEEKDEDKKMKGSSEHGGWKKRMALSNVACQVENCEAKLKGEKKYYQWHKVCERHAKAATVLVGGVDQRYCQQCSRFHELSQFDDTKRSCRKRLADHNERRRKSLTEQQTDESDLIPAVLKVKDNSLKPKAHLGGTKQPEVIKIVLPKNPNFKHFHIK
ncbi:squamosa promoter-binding-like protein 4 [Tasmannia lanceolata]|uniref:squamosa promoter-binding-like protein 4 n=1 Tax=Tasmannia lanceolata TaxID=3420 RepID=UPI004063FF1D